jgi:predicted Fe-Mo cluster-binding NifX family protein
MKIAIPAGDDLGINASVFPHFGRCPFYVLFDTDTGKVQVIENKSNHFGGDKSPPEFLHEQGASAVICRDIGSRAVSIFGELGIKVYLCSDVTAKEAIAAWEEKTLRQVSQDYVCGEHSKD